MFCCVCFIILINCRKIIKLLSDHQFQMKRTTFSWLKWNCRLAGVLCIHMFLVFHSVHQLTHYILNKYLTFSLCLFPQITRADQIRHSRQWFHEESGHHADPRNRRLHVPGAICGQEFDHQRGRCRQHRLRYGGWVTVDYLKKNYFVINNSFYCII